jgi:hypothetical protein
VVHEAVPVPGAELEERLHVETVPIGDTALDRAQGNHVRSALRTGPSCARADLSEALDRDGGSLEAAPELGESGLCGSHDAVAGRKVVHAHSLVALGPERKLGLPILDEVRGVGPHVRARQEGLFQRFEGPEVGRQDGGTVAASEPHSGLGTRIGHAARRELPGHRPREPRDLGHVDVRDHSRPARRHREELVVDDDDGVEPGLLVPQLDDARGWTVHGHAR